MASGEQNMLDGDKVPEPVDELRAVPHKPIRAHGNETNYRYGLIEGAPRVLALLHAHGARATWTAAGLALERAPELARAIAARGDEVCCHGWRGVHQFQTDEADERDFICKGRDAIARATGTAPVGWLSRYLYTDNTRRILAEEGFTDHMDDFSRDAPFWGQVTLGDGTARPMVILPYALDTNDMKFWLTPAYSPEDWLRYAINAFDLLYEEGGGQPRMMSLGLHLRMIGRPGRILAFKAFLDHAAAKPRVRIAPRRDRGAVCAQLPPPSA